MVTPVLTTVFPASLVCVQEGLPIWLSMPTPATLTLDWSMSSVIATLDSRVNLYFVNFSCQSFNIMVSAETWIKMDSFSELDSRPLFRDNVLMEVIKSFMLKFLAFVSDPYMDVLKKGCKAEVFNTARCKF